MKIHRFIGDFDLKKEQIELTGETAHQIGRVLKLKTGEKIELCDGKHISAIAEICNVNKNSVQVKILNLLRQGSEGQNNTKKVTLFCAVLKKENFETVVEKATECGITKIVPIVSDRTIKTGLNIERLRKIAKEASEQSGRINVPEISEPVKFSPTKNYEINIIFDASGELLFDLHKNSLLGIFSLQRRRASKGISNSNYPSAPKDNSTPTKIWIGPEGGWTPEELEKAKNAGFLVASLGPLTLRGETAAIIASYLAVNL